MSASMSHLAAELQKFRKLSEIVLRFPPKIDSRHEIEINNLLDEFNSIDYGTKFIKDDVETCRLLCRFSENIGLSNDHLVTKYCQLVSQILEKQTVTVDDDALHTLVDYLNKCIMSCGQWTLPNTLRALGALLYENTGRLNKNPKTPYLDDELIETCLQLFMKVLSSPRNSQDDEISHCRNLVSALKGMQNILTFSRKHHSKHLGVLLAALKYHMMSGLPGQSERVPDSIYPLVQSDTPTSPAPTPPSSPTVDATAYSKRNKRAETRKKKRKPGKKSIARKEEKRRENLQSIDIGEQDEADPPSYDRYGLTNTLFLRPAWQVSSSESECSDTEGGQVVKLRSMHTKVRHCAFTALLRTIESTDKKLMFAYWPSFIPDSPSTGVGVAGPQMQTLITSVMKDPSPKVRMSALVALTALLDGSKQYLAAAEDKSQARTSFTPFSISLGYMIKELHRSLLLAMSAENSFLALTQNIKCLAVLILNVPYHRLSPGLLTKIARQLKPFYHHRDPNIKVACLTCLGSLSQVASPEVLDILHNPQLGGAGDDTVICETQSLQRSWIIGLCTRNLLGNTVSPQEEEDEGCFSGKLEPLPVRLESMQVLTTLAKNYFSLIQPLLQYFGSLIERCLKDKEPAVQLHAAKLLEEIGFSILQSLQIKGSSVEGATQTKSERHISVDEALKFWMVLINGPLLGVLQLTPQSSLQATICDCLSNMGAAVFELLPESRKIACITLLLGLTSDEDYRLRGAAVRTLGFFVLYPSLTMNQNFIMDSAAIMLEAITDSAINVRNKAAWSIGNLCDVLNINKDAGNTEFMNDIPDSLLLQLFQASIAAAADNDRVKYSAVRALGNLLHYVPPRCLDEDVVMKAISTLVKNILGGAVKVRWNACYALGNMFRNNDLPLHETAWARDVYKALGVVIQECKNFKVRINAALALSVPSERDRYGTQFIPLWTDIIGALESSENMEDFSEFKYKDNLTDTLCGTLLHMAALVRVDDLTELHSATYHKIDVMISHLAKYARQQPAALNMGGQFDVAAKRLASFRQDGLLSKSDQSAVADLSQLFIVDIEAKQ